MARKYKMESWSIWDLGQTAADGQWTCGGLLLGAEPLLLSAYWKSRDTKTLSKATAAFPLVLSWSKTG